MAKSDATYSCETARETRHAQLDEVYSKPFGSAAATEISSVEEPSGDRKSAHTLTLTDDSIKASGTVVLDGDGWRSLAKHASRRATAQAR